MYNQIIMRPVFNRPEMLQLSIDYEVKARETYSEQLDFITLFVIEYGAPDKVLDIIQQYPYKKYTIQRYRNFGLSANILEGMKVAFDLAASFVLYIEDDILLHKTYFNYVAAIMGTEELKRWSVISPFSFDDEGDVCKVRKDRHYAALAPIISKYFFDSYIRPCANANFYNNPANFVCDLNNLYKEYWDNRVYRYKDSMHHQQAGLINRLCDVARIEEGLYVVMPEVNRIQHIGFFGHNRPGGELKGSTFDERLYYLKEIIKFPELMYKASGTKQYDDYKAFSPKLDSWDGTLTLADKHFTS